MTEIPLSSIRSPADLQGLRTSDLENLAVQIRAMLIEKVRQSGGHLGSNLGVVELTLALHRVFDFCRDRLVFDVSHQSYVHKMLTGRVQEFDTLRKTDGMSGFCNRDESPWDLLTAGHAGTAISFAVGLAEGMRSDQGTGEDAPWSVALVGDAGLACGVAFEALNHAGVCKPRMIVVLNDNEWSIARSVGAMARYLSRVRTSRTMQFAYERLSSLTHRIPWLGSRLEEMGEVMRHVLVPGHLFEELGVNYVGPLDGHDLDACLTALERVKRLNGVHLVHFLTEKGRGFQPASEDAERAHGVAPSAKVPQAKAAKFEEMPRSSFTSWFSKALMDAGRADSRVVALTAAMPTGTGMQVFAEQWPDRFYDTGITEQHAVAMAGGLATAGRKPIVAIYSTFLQRGYDQVFQEVAVQRESVLFCLDRAGLVGQDGPTHQGLYDMAYLRVLPGITLASPRDGADLRRLVQAALGHEGPWALRWPRATVPEIVGTEDHLRPELIPGTAERLRSGKDGAVLALGAMVETVLEAASLLADQGVELEVWDARFCRPLDVGVVGDLARRHGAMATVEEHALAGGFGSAVAETLADLSLPVRLSRHGVPDRFIAHASLREEQLAGCGLTAPQLVESWKDFFVPSPASAPETSSQKPRT